MKEIVSQENGISRWRFLLMLGVLGLAYFFSNFHRLSLGIVGPDVAKEFNLSSAQLGLLGSAFFYAYAFMQVPAGIIVDRMGSRTAITISCIVSALCTLWFATGNSFDSFLISRGVTGLALAFVYVPALALIRQWTDDKNLGTMTGVLVAMGQAGTIFATLPLQLATNAIGWRNTFLLIAYVTIALSVLVWVSVKNRKKPPETSKTQDCAKEKASYKLIFKPVFIVLALWTFITAGTRLSFRALWGTQYFVSVLENSKEQSSFLLLCISVGSMLGALVLGRIADKYGSTRVVIGSGAVTAGLWVLLMLLSPDSSFVYASVICFVLGLISTGGFSVSYSCIREFADKSSTGLLTGIITCVSFLGTAIFTQYSGVLFDYFKNMTITSQYNTLLWVFSASNLLVTVGVAVIYLQKKSAVRCISAK